MYGRFYWTKAKHKTSLTKHYKLNLLLMKSIKTSTFHKKFKVAQYQRFGTSGQLTIWTVVPKWYHAIFGYCNSPVEEVKACLMMSLPGFSNREFGLLFNWPFRQVIINRFWHIVPRFKGLFSL